MPFLKLVKITSSNYQKLPRISRVMANRYFGRLIKERILVKKGRGRKSEMNEKQSYRAGNHPDVQFGDDA